MLLTLCRFLFYIQKTISSVFIVIAISFFGLYPEKLTHEPYCFDFRI